MSNKCQVGGCSMDRPPFSGFCCLHAQEANENGNDMVATDPDTKTSLSNPPKDKGGSE